MDRPLRNLPFFLRPVGKDYLWGGNRLNEDFDKKIDMSPLAETWECSTHPDGTSIVASGKWEGWPLNEVLKAHPEYIGTHPRAVMRAFGLPEYELPVLIKLIDAQQDLSIQVHPDDVYAYEKENGQLGKTEMWYVLDAARDATLIYGLNRDASLEQIRRAIQNDTLDKYLQKVSIQKNDVFFIPAGTIHAIGAGALVAEIQESSNLTYRLYDYGRMDKNGNLRELHVDKALEVADLKGAPLPTQPMRVLKYRRGIATELLCRCRYFQVERVLLNTKHSVNDLCDDLPGEVSYRTESNSFTVLLCVDGHGTISFGREDVGEKQKGNRKEDEKENFPVTKGECIFIPADSVEVKLQGRAQLLKVSC